MIKIDFKEMLKMQEELDSFILKNKRVEGLHEMKLIALNVEVCEMFNEIRSFKHWSKKGPSSKEIILEEFVDVVHFWLSIVNDYIKDGGKQEEGFVEFEIKTPKYFEEKKNIVLNELHLFIVDCISTYNNFEEFNDLYNIMGSMIIIAELLGFTAEDIEKAYKEKHEINYKRQREGY